MNQIIRKIKQGIRKVLRWLKNFLFGFRGTAIYCPYCKSYNVEPTTESQILNNGKWHETYHLECKKCHAVAHMTEMWSMKDNSKEIK